MIDRISGRYVRVDKRMLRDRGPTAALIYAIINERCEADKGRCVITRREILELAEETGLTESAVRQRLLGLVNTGYLRDTTRKQGVSVYSVTYKLPKLETA